MQLFCSLYISNLPSVVFPWGPVDCEVSPPNASWFYLAHAVQPLSLSPVHPLALQSTGQYDIKTYKTTNDMMCKWVNIMFSGFIFVTTCVAYLIVMISQVSITVVWSRRSGRRLHTACDMMCHTAEKEVSNQKWTKNLTAHRFTLFHYSVILLQFLAV